MTRPLMRTVVASTSLAAAAAFGVLPASAANDSPNAPRAAQRYEFCANPGRWYPGYFFYGTSNDGRYGEWRISRIVDDPRQTRIDATFIHNSNGSAVSWYCR